MEPGGWGGIGVAMGTGRTARADDGDRSLTAHLVLFAAVLLMPVLVAAGAVIGAYAFSERERYAEAVQTSAQDLVVLLDRELAGIAATVRALALSEALERSDLAAFHRSASGLGAREGLRFVLLAPDGRRLLDTGRPWDGAPAEPGAPLPAARPDGEAAFSGLLREGGTDGYGFAVVLPVAPAAPSGMPTQEAGDRRLAALVPVARLQRLLMHQAMPDEGSAAYVDGAGTILARFRDPATFVGLPVSDALSTDPAETGVRTGPSRDGVVMLTGHATSRPSGWRAVVGVPRSLVAAPARRSLTGLLLACAAMALLCALGASMVGRRIAGPIASLAAAARALGRAEPVGPVRSGIREVDAVGDALATAAAELAERRTRLVEGEERLRLALEAGRLGSWDLDLARGRRVFSARSAEILGVASDGMAERAAWTRFVHPEDHDLASAALAAAIAGGAPYNVEFRVQAAGGEERWVASQAIVLRDAAGAASRVIGIHRDVTARRRMEDQLRASEQRLRATQEHAGVGIAEVDAEGRYLALNEAFAAITGYGRDELLGRSLFSLSPREDAATDRERFERLVAGTDTESYAVEKRFVRGDGTVGWIAVSASGVRDRAGRFLYGVRVVQDVTARRDAEASRVLLLHELNHRVKNTLATVQSVAMQSFRDVAAQDERGLQDARALFESRLLALSKAHDVLTREDWRGAGLREVVAQTLAPYRGEGTDDRIAVSGAPVRLAPRTALSLAMALHELATNAAKYGALSVADGRVTIAWSVLRRPAGRRLRLRWVEAGGPPVVPPRRRGFGSRLIERGLARELEGEVRLDFPAAGVTCLIDVPLEGGPRAAPNRAAA